MTRLTDRFTFIASMLEQEMSFIITNLLSCTSIQAGYGNEYVYDTEQINMCTSTSKTKSETVSVDSLEIAL